MFDFLRNLRKTAEEQQQEALTAYLDNALAPRERQQFEQELAQNPTLQAQLEAQRQVKTRLHALPRRRVPRNFTLDPALYGRPLPQPLFQLYPVLRAATVLNGIVLILMVALGSFSSRASLPIMVNSEEQQQVAAESAPAQAESADSATANVLVTVVTEGEVVLAPAEEAPGEPAAELAEDVVEESVVDGGGVTAVSSQVEAVGVATVVQMTSVVQATAAPTVAATVQAPVIVVATATVSALPRPEATPTPDTNLRNSTEEPALPPEIAANTVVATPTTTQSVGTFYESDNGWLWPAFLFATWVILLVATLYVRRQLR